MTLRPVQLRGRSILMLFCFIFVLLISPGALATGPVYYMAPSGWFCTQAPGWVDADVGSVGLLGSANNSSGTFTVSGSGSQIYGSSDAFHFVYQRLYGDGNIVARIVSVQGGSAYAAAGVMIRETLDTGSTNAKVAYWPWYGGLYFDARTSTGGTTAEPGSASGTPPYWVQLVRSGNTFTGYASPDGVNWTQMGPSQTINMAQSVYIGLAVTSGNNSALATATFDNISTSSDTAMPCISSLSATTGNMGSEVVITGSGFGSTQGNSQVTLAGTPVTINSWSEMSIDITIPTGATSGSVVAYVPSPAYGIADAASNAVRFTITSEPLPSGWVDADVGSVPFVTDPSTLQVTPLYGSANYASGTFTVSSAGNQISGTADAFHFVYQALSGDGSIVARVVSAPVGSQAGLMIRETLDAAAANANLTEYEYSSSYEYVYYYARTTAGGSQSYAGDLTGSGVVPPYWLKLVRSGNTITSYGSADGVNWTAVGTGQSFTMAQNVFIGLVVSSDNTSSLATATFDNVSLGSSSTVAPVISGVSATTGNVGSQVVISGTGFGATQGDSMVTLNGLPVTISSWSATSIAITIPTGATTGYLVVSLAPDMDDSNPVWFTVTSQPLPAGWLDQDVGTVGIVGSTGYASGTFTINGAGAGTTGGISDGFHFVYQPLSGDGSIVARVVSMPAGSQAGLMIRETLDAAAANANLTEYEYSSSYEYVYYYARTTAGGSESYAGDLTGSGVVPPYWLKLVRSGNTISSYGSADGVNWTQVGTSQTFTMAQNVYVGLVVSSDNTSSLATATFDSVSVNSAATAAPVITGVSATTGSVGSQVVITGTGFGASQGGSVVTLNGLPVTISSWSATSITITIPTGATTGYLVVSLAPDMDDSNPVWFTVTSQPLPAGWLDQDVGTVGIVGSAGYASGTFTINGAGGGTLSGNTDGFHFVYQPLSGDGSIVARVVSMPAGGQAGVMIRETLDAAAANANLTEYEYPSSYEYVYYYARTTAGGSESYAGDLTGSGMVPPYWLKLVRSGNTITGYGSADGVNWTQVGTSQTFTMAQNVYVGLVVSSDNTSSLATASFDSVSVNSAATAAPVITGVSATTGSVGSQVVITGTG
ncbi:MAG: IPT/TIG domain-containing protein, partial [Candidatus Sulfotelmatobacter sp.]